MALKREQVVRSAEKYVSRGKIDAAIREYSKVLAEQPGDTATLNRIGDLYARTDRLDEAVGTFTQIAEKYTADGFFVKAIAIYKKIIKLDPSRLEIYEKLAELYHRQGLLNEARTQYQVLADYYLKHDNATSATAIYERMAEVDPEDPGLRAKLAELYQGLKLSDKAMAQYAAIAEMMLVHGHAEEAEQVYLRALDVDADNVAFLTDATLKLRESAGKAAAARLLAAATERNPQAERVARMVGLERVEGGPAAEPAGDEEPAPDAAADAAAAEVDLTGDGEAALVLDLDAGTDLEGDLDLTGDLDLAPEPRREPRPAAGPEAGPEARPEAHRESRPESLAEPAQGAQPPVHEEFELDLDEVFHLDLEDDEAPASLVQPPPDLLEPSGVPAAAEPESESGFELRGAPGLESRREAETRRGLDIDPDLLERTAAELVPERVRQEEDLITEAEVLAKYGLSAKAAERVSELLALDPKHPGGLALGVRLHLEAAELRPAARLAERLAEVTGAAGETWGGTVARLEAAGFEVEDGRLALPPEAAAEEEPEADTTPGLDTLAGTEALEEAVPARPGGEEAEALEGAGAGQAEAAAAGSAAPPATDGPSVASAAPSADPRAIPPAGVPPARERRPSGGAARAGRRGEQRVADLLAEIASGVQPTPRRRPPAAPAQPAPPAAVEEPTAPTAAEAAAEGTAEGPTPVAPAAEAGAEASELAPPAAPAASAAPPAGEEAPPFGDAGGLFGGDADDFFDLAAELEEELARETSMEGDELLLPQPKEQSLEEIVAGFKKGVADVLSSEDYGTHFDLGIAYREMGLLDEAIGEFQIAAKDPSRLVQCCSMLGLSFLDKGLPELAIRWYRRGLEAPDLGEEDQLGLLYDLGNAYHALGERAEAYRTFVEIYGTNSHYRDIAAKLEETAPGR